MPTIGASAVSFEHVSREWRCKYSMDAEGGPAGSASLKACEALLQEYLHKLKALPAMEVRRVVCGGCGDFKVVLTQPCAEHDAWKASDYTVEGTQHPLPSLSALCLSLNSCSVAHCSQASSWRSSRLSVRRTLRLPELTRSTDSHGSSPICRHLAPLTTSARLFAEGTSGHEAQEYTFETL